MTLTKCLTSQDTSNIQQCADGCQCNWMIFTFISTRLIQLTRRTYQYKCNRLTSYVYNSTNDNTTRDSPTIRKPMYRSTPDKKGYIYDIFTELWEESSAYNQVPHLFRYFDWALSLRVLWRYKNKIHLKN